MLTPRRTARIPIFRAALLAGLAAAALAALPGCAPDLQAGCHDGLTECDGVCVDVTSDAGHCGACGHDCLGGACEEAVCQPVLLSSGPTRGFGLALDATGIYWTAQGVTMESEGEVRQASRSAGGASAVLASEQAAPRGVAVDEEYVYWTNGEGDTVRRVPKAGGEDEVIASGQTARDIALDAEHIYWTNATGEIMRAPRDLSAAPAAFYDGPDGPDGIALDATHVYWVNRLDGQVMKAPLEGTGGVAITLFSGAEGPTDIAVDGTHVTWSNHLEGEILRIPLDGGDSAGMVIATGQASPFGLAVDATHVYWASYGSGEVKRAPLAGGAEEVLTSGQEGPRRIALDDAAIYWTNHEGGQLMMLAR